MIVLRKIARPTTQEIYRSGTVVADDLVGALDGTNQVYFTTYKYRRDRITLFYNGQALHSPYDFMQTGDNEIKLTYVYPIADENVRATYELDVASYDSSRRGRQPIPIGVSSYDVVFTTAFADLDYTTSVELITSDGSPSVYSFVVGNKLESGFTVFFSGIIDTNNYVLEWAALR